MLSERDLSSSLSHGVETSGTRPPQPDSAHNIDGSDDKIGFSETGLDFLRESEKGFVGLPSKPSMAENSSSQELTFKYLCEKSKLGFPEKDFRAKGSPNSKGKEVILENLCQEEMWVERDFLHLNDNKGGSSKREFEAEFERGRDGRGKKPKLEELKLSLALPGVSLSLTASNAVQNGDQQPLVKPKPSRSVQSLVPSNNNTHTTCSNDYTAASLSYSYFSHNPSCSLTQNSTGNYDYSGGAHEKEADHIWNCGEGTNGSVHSRFRPLGGGVALSNHGAGVGYALMNGGWPLNKDSCNGIYRAASSDNTSFFPSELPARARVETLPADLRGIALDHVSGLDNLECSGAQRHSSPEKILLEIICASVAVMAQTLKELPNETIEMTKKYLRSHILSPESKNELVGLQNQLKRRSDLTRETLSKSHRAQLEILVAVKFGLEEFVTGKLCVPTGELVEIFLLLRCRNVNCRYMLPVDDCDCKICSTKKGFCSQCMCPICWNFDCANNTCSWVGCDVCSHWCHASCGIEKKLIRPGPSLKGTLGTPEMQFHCVGCGHASEMFGFVKDVFKYCAKNWDRHTLMKELDCVRKIFEGSEDVKGKELHIKSEEIITRLERAAISPSDACNFIIQFFNYGEGKSDLPAPAVAPKEPTADEPILIKEIVPPPVANSLLQQNRTLNMCSSGVLRNLLSHGQRQGSHRSSPCNDSSLRALSKNDDFEGLEGVVRMKEAESRMFQKRADEARKEAEGYRRLVQARTEKLEEEYTEKLSKFCLHETEERRRKKLEELKVLESSHCDYYNMKVRMEAEITGLLERMEATKQQWI
ncbi:hypothetical protein Nepgr_016974 [Nepenthes gracilis]|uniref:Protein OBERON 3 n=1 Tax=Nepenthes gracilis TaxID=150966 RepID=A0AAD3XS27_NEPGR|nr:hypothetical protein Nepgr_016974 [Nepenthes gracilis]